MNITVVSDNYQAFHALFIDTINRNDGERLTIEGMSKLMGWNVRKLHVNDNVFHHYVRNHMINDLSKIYIVAKNGLGNCIHR